MEYIKNIAINDPRQRVSSVNAGYAPQRYTPHFVLGGSPRTRKAGRNFGLTPLVNIFNTGVEGIVDTVVGAKEFATSIAKSPVGFAERMITSRGNIRKSLETAARPIQDAPLALKEIFKNDRRSALSSASHLGRHMPVIGNFVPGRYPHHPPTGRRIINIYDRGIGGSGNLEENLKSTQYVRNYLEKNSKKQRVEPAPYRSGTITDVITSLLSINKTPSYRALQQLRELNLKPGDLVNLLAHSGGVQRMADLSHLLGLRGINVNKLIGAAGPVVGRYNNVRRASFAGSPSVDPVSYIQKRFQPLSFIDNQKFNFNFRARHHNPSKKKDEYLPWFLKELNR